MQKFNQSITVTIEVDQIANQLRATMGVETPNADLICETIVGRMLASDMPGLGKLFSALNGHRKEIPLEVGSTIKIRPGALRVYGYWTPESIEKKDTVHGTVHDVTVKTINPYADREVEVEYMVPKIDGTMKLESTWVSASEFTF